METRTTIPYSNPMLDGHGFTRDLMWGNLIGTSQEDAMSGIPMFARYQNQFDFMKETKVDFKKMTGGQYVVQDQNKMREIGFLPAMAFTEETGSMRQVSVEQPIEEFTYVGEIPLEITVMNPEGSAEESTDYIYKPIGVGHSANSTYIFFVSGGSLYYLDEENYATKIEVIGSVVHNFTDTSYATSYGGEIYITNGNKIFKFEDGIVFFFAMDSMVDRKEHFILGGIRVYDLINHVSIPNEEKYDYPQFSMINDLYKYEDGIGRFCNFGAYKANDIGRGLSINHGTPPSKIAIELKLSGIDPTRLSRLYGKNYERDIQVYTHEDNTKTFAISKDYKEFEDTSVIASSFDIGSGGVDVYRTHNGFYIGHTVGGKRSLAVFSIRTNKVYGNSIYQEKGRVWQY